MTSAMAVKGMNKAICDKCGKKFKIKLHTKDKDNMQITYFKCPKCYKEYIVNVTDEKLREDMLKAIELRNKMINNVDNNEAIRDYHILKNKNCIRGKQLKEEYLGD